MCGIAGWIGRTGASGETCDGILRAQRHRGPDGQGVREFPEGVLLHTRLKILDLTDAAAQPLSNEDGGVWIVFNGEIYNHAELRRELESRGHRFRSRTDSEVLPHLYEEHGEAFVDHLRGMFAVAVLDRKRRKLVLVRDRLGIKPLFYASTGAFVAFASEINALRLIPGVDDRPDAQAIHDFAALHYVPAPGTLFRGIRALRPAERLSVQWDGDRCRSHASTYHRWTVAPDPSRELSAASEQAEELIREAVASQLQADVPLGVMLSGGIDSSLVAAFAARTERDGDPLRTYNVKLPGGPGGGEDETWAATRVADALGTEHRTLAMDPGATDLDALLATLRAPGQPLADPALFGAHRIAGLMREHVTVALSGDGGDEGFGGYGRDWLTPLGAHLQDLPPALRWLTALPAGILGGHRRVIRALRDLPGRSDTEIMDFMARRLPAEDHARLLRGEESYEPLARLFEPRWDHHLPSEASGEERLSARLTEVNVRMILGSQFLPKTDTASMLQSLEVRVPLLDERLVAFGLTLPFRLKVRGRQRKLVLRSIAERRLPASVARKPKQGFAVPLRAWAPERFREQLRGLLAPGDSPIAEYFRPETYLEWLEAAGRGRAWGSLHPRGVDRNLLMLLSLHAALTHEPGV